MENPKNIAILSHVTIIGTIVAIMVNNDDRNDLVSYYNRQTLGLFLSFFILSYFIGNFNSWVITTSLYVVFIVFWVISLVGAINQEKKELPFVGKYFQEFFKNL
jgi:uncharacterized membrane protein